ncbi:MAG: hypothetical protein WAV01_02030 [Candidatus Saccharimonadales bacterium]
MTKLIWNGVDGYMDYEVARVQGMLAEDGKLYTQREAFEAFSVGEEIKLESLPLDSDGDPDISSAWITESFRVYRKI